MFNKSSLFQLAVLFTAAVAFSGWHNNSAGEITKHYYYQGQQFHLTLKPDAIFVKLDGAIPQQRLNSILNGENLALNLETYNENEDRFFVNLSSSVSEVELTLITTRLSDIPEILYASPVFSPDNGKTLIGVENEVIVQFKPVISENAINSFIQSKGLSIKQTIDVTGGKTYVLTVPDDRSAIDISNEIFLSNNVNYSEPNLFFTNLLTTTEGWYVPNDPFFPMQWSIKNTGSNIPGGITGIPNCDMVVDSAWSITLGSSNVIVAISDTGVDTLHPDLANNLVPGTGWNFFNNTPGAWDDHNHGTACAGIVAGIADNNIGVTGVAPLSKMIPVKWMNSSGSGNYTGASGATIWSYQKGAWVISNSWGFVGGASALLDNAILDAVTLGRNGKGSLFVVAAGNEGNSTPGVMRYPASTNPNVLVVGGLSPCNQRKSNTSCDNETFWGASFGSNLDIVAPCVKVYTTIRTSVGSYTSTFNGTSSATPNTAGVCALVLAVDSTLTWDSIRARIDWTAEKVGSYTYNQPGPRNFGGWNNEMGYGKVHGYRVVKATQDMIAGSPLVAFNLQTPAPGATITSFPMSNTPVTITWDTSGINASFRWIFGTSLPTRLLSVTTGTANSLTMSLGQLDAILENLSIPTGGSIAGQWDVWAYRSPSTTGPDSLKASNGPRNITLQRGIPSLSPFSLNSPPNNTTITTSVFNNTNVNINWTRSGQGTTYKWKFGSPTISSVMLTVPSASNGYDSTLSFINSELDIILGSLNVQPGDSVAGQWAVWAYNGLDSVKSTQTWNITLKRQDKGDILILYDSISATGRAARDTVMNVLGNLEVTFDLFNRGSQTSTNAMTLRGYKKVMLLGSGTSVMNTRLKDSVIAYLNSGGTTVETKSKFIILAEDIGYQFGRTGSTYLDLNFVNNYLGWQYVADRPASGANQGLIGHVVNSGMADSTNGTFPDVLRIQSVPGSTAQHVLYLYRRQINNLDSASGIGIFNTTYNAATLGSDARNLLRATDSPVGPAANRIIKGLLDYVDQLTVSTDPIAGNEIPMIYELSQNYPNPFNPSTKINFAIPKQGMVMMKIFDITGREVAMLVNEVKNPGYYSVDFNASILASGVYFYRLEAQDFIDVKRMVLIK